jgi:hypothetical protein
MIILTYNEPLIATTAAPGAFKVMTTIGLDSSENVVTAVAIVGNKVELTLTTALSSTPSDITTVAYVDPTTGNDVNAVQDAAGRDAASLAATRVGFNGVDVASGNGDLFVSLTTQGTTTGNGTAAFDLGFTMSQAQSWNGVSGLQLQWNLATGAFTSNNSAIAASNATLGNYGSALATFNALSANTATTAQMSVLAFDSVVNSGSPGFGTTGQSVMSTLNLITASGLPTQPGATTAPTNSALLSTFGNVTVANYTSLMNEDPGMASAVGFNTAVNGENDHYIASMATFGGFWTALDNNGNYVGNFTGTTNVFSGQNKALPFFQFYASSVNAGERGSRVAFGVDLDADGTIEFDNNGATAGGNNEFGLFSLQGDVLTYKNPGTFGTATVSGVTVNGSAVELTLASPVSGQSVTVAYVDPTAGNDANAIQDIAGNDAAGLVATVFYGSTGSDNLLFDADAISRIGNLLGVSPITGIDGRGGIDTLQIDGSGVNLNLTLIGDAVITDIETIDMTGSGNNTLTLALSDVLVISSTTDTLTIDGNSGDVVNAGSGWTDGGVIGAYHQYTQGTAVLLVDEDMTRNIFV